MHCPSSDYRKVRIQVVYRDALSKKAAKIGVNGEVMTVLKTEPSWTIVPEGAIMPASSAVVRKDVIFFQLGENSHTRQVIWSMVKEGLRPVLAKEFIETVKEVSEEGSLYTLMVCLGSMWGEAGQEQLFAWGETGALLRKVNTPWKAGTCFPTIPYRGTINRF